ncbi:UDP-glucuronic acid decarboxylase family protein [Marinitenerispora sediminis]|uniref:Epimerase n=1 Tax=Marinitenerispora sediminis TaxID=1931232 RepID=A0A368SZ09_9ACTN|nr:UDP-glucuronic acid decarboxylase family protein [Marinitenerispora sediminis]RCV47855.1 epimerase [Marinitenerispora sediminis]RCV48902.1 epimerase [Marinitenerispora sediminis]RCV50452.1 epimerase [Marinitenerispora sediminis]
MARHRTGRAVVTGGAGFVGSHLCERLLERGSEVVCVDNFATGSPRNVRHLSAAPGFRLVEADVTRPLADTGPVDTVFHLASAASPADYLRLPEETLEAGSLGTRTALRLALRHGARMVLASTSEVYGDPLQYPQQEGYWGNVNPIGPRSVYDEAKRYAEALTMAYHRTHGTDVAIARIFNCYGPRMRPDDGRAVPTFIGQALAGEAITVSGDGLQTRSICYVDDTVRGLLALADSGATGPVNIGSTEELSMLRLAELVRRLAGSGSPIVHIGRPADDPRFRRPDTRLAEKLLDWRPAVRMEEGLRRTIDWFMAERAVPAARSAAGEVTAG